MAERLGHSLPQPDLRLSAVLIPNHLERLAKISPEALGVSYHELNHWVVARHHKFLGDISLTPKGYSRARTTFYGYIPPWERSHILAAGAVDLPEYEAFGYQMDKLMLEYNVHNGGDSWEDAKAKSNSIIHDFGIEILQRGAEIMAFMSNERSEFSSETIELIFVRARQELIIEGKNNHLKWSIEPINRQQAEKQAEGRRTVFEDTRHEQTVILVKDDTVEQEESVCRICGKLDGEHNVEKHKEFEVKENQLKQYNPPEIKGTIKFSEYPKLKIHPKLPEIKTVFPPPRKEV